MIAAFERPQHARRLANRDYCKSPAFDSMAFRDTLQRANGSRNIIDSLENSLFYREVALESGDRPCAAI